MTQPGQIRVVDSYELSPTQEGMLFHGLLGEATGVDLEQIVCTVRRGPSTRRRSFAAFQEVASRHAILRTRFSYDDAGRPVQEVVETVEIPVERVDLTRRRSVRALTADSRKPFAVDRARGIDLEHAPAMRLLIVDWCAERASRRLDVPPRPARRALVPPRAARGVRVLRRRATGRDARPPAATALPRVHRVPPRPRPRRGRGATGAAYLAGFTAPTPLVIDRPRPTTDRRPPIQGVSERRLSPGDDGGAP